MEIYPIYAYGHPILRQQAAPIPLGTDVKEMVERMIFTSQQTGAVGLAAPQIGQSLQLFIVDMDHLKLPPDQVACFGAINPIVELFEEEKIVMEEGCMSIPEIRVPVERSLRLKMKYYDEEWQFQERVFEGFLARVIQHEYDHLMGKLHIDYGSPTEKKLMEAALEKIRKGDIQPDYKMVFAGGKMKG